MAKKPKVAIEILAVWLFQEDLEKRKFLRELCRDAMNRAKEMYDLSPDHPNFDPLESPDGYGVKAILARFISELDEQERQWLIDHPNEDDRECDTGQPEGTDR